MPSADRATPLDGASYITDTGPSSGSVISPRSHLASDAPELSLDGQWKFRLLPSAPGTHAGRGVLPAGEELDSFAMPGFDDSGWESLGVPAHWVLAGDGIFGPPIYTNVQFPFATEAPQVPDANPTGDYRRRVDVPAEWFSSADYSAILLRFEGVESRYRVWVNGHAVGVGVGSRLTNEFDVTAYVQAGENLIVVRVHQWSASSYVEDQDQWWLPGIFRSVSLLARPAAGIDDLWVQADFDHHTLIGTIITEICSPDTAYPISFSVPSLGVETVWADRAAVRPIEVGSVHPWSADDPHLYPATVASATETLKLRLGFRTVRIVGDSFQVNGTQVAFHGVNRHESDPDKGRVFDEVEARRDLTMMKRYNVNSIRTSHYPPNARLLDLADELGFWVVVECDFETHGFEQLDGPEPWAGNPSADPRWRDALIDRMRRTVERDKNHPSIVMWSLGNESGTGANLAAMSSWVHNNDPSRPVHYEGDFTGSYTDVYSRMYATIPEIQAIGDGRDTSLLLNCSAAESARQRTKPFILCEYAHAMGNGPGALDQYEEYFQRYPRLHGGFVWEWRDHGLSSTTRDGEPFHAYGGDFGEVVHDGNFVMDGLTLSNGRATPALDEFAAVVSPIRFAFFDEGRRLVVTNARHSADTSDLKFDWLLSIDGHEVGAGPVVIDPIAPGGSTIADLQQFTRSDAAETWITVTARLEIARSWAAPGHLVARAQHDLTPPRVRRAQLSAARFQVDRRPLSVYLSPKEPAESLRLGPAEFSEGKLARLLGQRVDGPRLALWRAPTDNDEGSGVAGSFDLADPWSNGRRGTPAPPHADEWRRMGLDRLVGRLESVEESPTWVRRLTRWAAANIREAVYLQEHWALVGQSVVLHVDLEPTHGWDIIWPRLGIRFDFDQQIDQVRWFGTGPNESYPDSTRAARVGRFEAPANSLIFPYARPQESGHRSDVRSLTLSGGGSALNIDFAEDTRGRLPGFTVSKYSPEQLSTARHVHELPDSDRTYLHIDAAQNGLGSRSCGPDVWPDHLLRPEARSLTVRFSEAEPNERNTRHD